MKDRSKPLEDRYVHQITTTPDGGALIFTFNVYLLSLCHEATSLHMDTTFKRSFSDLKEVEIVMWLAAVQRGEFYSITT